MTIEVWDGPCKADKGLANYVGLRLMSVLDHQVRRIERVTVYVTGADHRAGPTPRRCRMIAWLRPSGRVLVQDIREGLYAAIDSAAERLADGLALDSGPTATAVARPRRSVDPNPASPSLLAAAATRR
jgi:hypothetical protein